MHMRSARRVGTFDTGTIKLRQDDKPEWFSARGLVKLLSYHTCAYFAPLAMEVKDASGGQPSSSAGTSPEDDSASVLNSLGEGWGLYQARLLILW